MTGQRCPATAVVGAGTPTGPGRAWVRQWAAQSSGLAGARPGRADVP